MSCILRTHLKRTCGVRINRVPLHFFSLLFLWIEKFSSFLHRAGISLECISLTELHRKNAGDGKKGQLLVPYQWHPSPVRRAKGSAQSRIGSRRNGGEGARKSETKGGLRRGFPLPSPSILLLLFPRLHQLRWLALDCFATSELTYVQKCT